MKHTSPDLSRGEARREMLWISIPASSSCYVGSTERIKLRSVLLSCFRNGAETFDMSLQVSCPDRWMRLQSRINMDLR